MIEGKVTLPVCGKDEYGVVSCLVGKTRFVNLTPHKITIQTRELGAIDIPPSGKVLRLQTLSEEVGKIEGIPVVRVSYGKPEFEPPVRENTYYIVSTPVIEHFSREDFIAPDTSPEGVVRDTSGRIIGTKRFRVGNFAREVHREPTKV